ncbi:hypothetical protein ACVWXU_004403 [Streptomyces sp. TE33382]
MGQGQRDAHRGGRHGRDHELVELRQPAPGAEPGQPVPEHRAGRRHEEDQHATADQDRGRTGEQPGGGGQHPARVRVPVAADLREAPVGLLQRDIGLFRGDVVDQPEHGGQPGVVRSPAAYGTARRHRVVDQRRLVRDGQQGERDGGLRPVQTIRTCHREHRRLDVLGALAARQQQLPDAECQVEHARHGGAHVVRPLHALGGRALGHRHPQHRAHPVLPGGFLGQPDHRTALRRSERGRRMLGAVGPGRRESGTQCVGVRPAARAASRTAPGRGSGPRTGAAGRIGLHTGRQGELGRRMVVLGRRGGPARPGRRGEGAARLVGLGLLVLGTALFRHHSTPLLVVAHPWRHLCPVWPRTWDPHANGPPREPGTPRGGTGNGRHTHEGVPPVPVRPTGSQTEPEELRQCAPPWASRRLYEASISASASARPTQSAPSTDLPGSRSL